MPDVRTLNQLAMDEIDGSLCFSLHRELNDPEVVARFTVDGEPVSKQRPRLARGRNGKVYTPEPTRVAEERIAWAFRAKAGPQALDPEHGFGIFIGFFCKSGQRRDVDNLTKLVLDGLNGVAWADDYQVTEISAKVVRFDPDPRTEVVIYRTPLKLHPETQCAQCGRTFRIYPSTYANVQFCSRTCQSIANTVSMTCPQCGGEFRMKRSKIGSGQVHCSRDCQRAVQAANLVTLTCRTCRGGFTVRPSEALRRVYCSKACYDGRGPSR